MFKKILNYIKNPHILIRHLAIFRLLDWLNDETYLKRMYKGYFKKKLNLENPRTFSEKIQWLKLNDRKPLYSLLVDKYEVRKYVGQRYGEDILIPIYGVWDNFDDIDFDKLPDSFVVKTTHDSGGVVVVPDKSAINYDSVKKVLSKSLHNNYYYGTKEWPYKNIRPRIIAEKYLTDSTGDILDYKLMVFNGKVEMTLVVSERQDKLGPVMDFYDNNWQLSNLKREGKRNAVKQIQKPYHYDLMVKIAEDIGKLTSFVRVDFYEIDNQLFFGEITFYPASGFEKFEPEMSDELLGDMLVLQEDL